MRRWCNLSVIKHDVYTVCDTNSHDARPRRTRRGNRAGTAPAGSAPTRRRGRGETHVAVRPHTTRQVKRQVKASQVIIEGEVFYMRRKTNPAVTRTYPATPRLRLTRGAPHTGSDIRLKPHMNGDKAAGQKTTAMRRARRTPFSHNICEPAPLNTLVRLGGLQGRRRRAKRP